MKISTIEYHPKPNFLLVGAPKSGTTSLYKYLKKHPDIFMPAIKEIAYFDSDLSSKINLYASNEPEYLAWFANRKEKLLGEASVWYLYSEKAAEEIYKFNPDMKIVIILRNPAKMIYSLHSQLVFNGWEDREDFGKALMLEEERKRGVNIPANCSRPKTLLYREVGKYYKQVKRYVETFGSNNVKVIIFNELIEDPESVCGELLAFLGASGRVNYELPHSNENKVLRSAFIRDLFIKPTKLKLQIWKLIPRTLRPRIVYFTHWINSKKTSRLPLDMRLEIELKTYFKKDIKKLEKLLGKNLSYWYD